MSDELISRKGAIFALGERPISWTDSDYELGLQNQYDIDRARLEHVPTAQPKTGKWIPQKGGGCCCSECGRYALDEVDGNFIHVSAKSKYCPHCGVMMLKEGD